MEMTRRRFTAAAAMAVAAGAIPSWARARQGGAPGTLTTVLDWSRIGEGAHVATGGGGNSLVVKDGHRALLIDTKVCGYGAVLGREIGLLGAGVELVINTHHHGDHTGGNSNFTPNTRVVAHEKAKPRVVRQREKYRAAARSTLNELVKSGAESSRGVTERVEAMVTGWDEIETGAFAPTETVSGDKSLTFGDHEALVRHAGAGHTDNDLFVYFPDLNVVHTGDLVFHGINAYVDTTAGVDIDGWIRSCEKMLEYCDEETVVVPGHGEVTDRGGIQKQIDYFGLLRRTVEHARDTEGKSKEEVQAIVPDALKDHGYPQLLEMNLGLLYDKEV